MRKYENDFTAETRKTQRFTQKDYFTAKAQRTQRLRKGLLKERESLIRVLINIPHLKTACIQYSLVVVILNPARAGKDLIAASSLVYQLLINHRL